MKSLITPILMLFCALSVWAQQERQEDTHFTELKQLTFGGNNMGARFSFDGKKLSFQSDNPQWDLKCAQTYYLIIEEAEDNKTYQPVLVSNGEGVTKSSGYLPGDKKMLYASTFKTSKECPPAIFSHEKYFLAAYPGFDIFVGDEKGKLVKQLTATPGYDAEPVISPQGDKIVFSSMRDGDPNLYIMDADGKNVKQLTYTSGYEGSASFSPDGQQLVFCASGNRGKDSSYKELLGRGLVSPENMALYIINIDGSGLKKIPTPHKANLTPSFHPGGRKIIFSAGSCSKEAVSLQFYMINTDGKGLKQITNEGTVNLFPVFSPDGKKLAFSSSRGETNTDEINLFITDWTEEEIKIAD